VTVCDRGRGKDTYDVTLLKFFIMDLHMKPDIDSDTCISLSAVTDVFCILRDVTMC